MSLGQSRCGLGSVHPVAVMHLPVTSVAIWMDVTAGFAEVRSNRRLMPCIDLVMQAGGIHVLEHRLKRSGQQLRHPH